MVYPGQGLILRQTLLTKHCFDHQICFPFFPPPAVAFNFEENKDCHLINLP